MPRKGNTSERDPVCGMRLAGLEDLRTGTYRGRRFVFCGDACVRRFKAAPDRFTGTPLIRLTGVRKTYGTGDAATHVLRGFDLHVWEGDFVVIIGASGSGKSTVLNMVGLLDRPTSGRVEIGGRDASHLSEDERALLRSETFGFIFQQYNLVPWLTAYENATLPLIFADRPVDRAWMEGVFAEVGLKDRMHHRPAQMSGGEQQRAALVRALASRPAILLGDEPTGNLDSQTGARILERLIRLHRQEKKTLVIVSHDATIAQKADQIIMVRDGLPVQNHRAHRVLST